jgi:hypothetical protein
MLQLNPRSFRLIPDLFKKYFDQVISRIRDAESILIFSLDSEIGDIRSEFLSFIFNGLAYDNPISAKLDFVPHLVGRENDRKWSRGAAERS